MNITQLKYFLELSEKLNFSAAASALYISQPALSRQINTLEEELQFQLFERNTKHVRLTKAGKSFAEDLSVIMNEFDFAVKKAQVIHNDKKNKLRIGIFDAPNINDFWSNFYRILLEIEPAIEIQVVRENFTELYNNFINETYDLILTLDHTLKKDNFPFCRKQLLYRKYSIVFSKNSEFGQKDSLSFADFENKNLYLVDNEGNLSRVLSELASVGILNPIVHKVANTLTLLAYLEAGNGYALIDKNAVQYNDLLQAFSKDDCFAGTYVTAVWRKESSLINSIMNVYYLYT